MVSMNPNPVQPQGFYLDPSGMPPHLPPDDPSKKVRKPYTITKTREIWTEQEHDKFLEAIQLFDRDWRKIEAFVGSKTVIQIRSHAQKYFLKVQKSGSNERVPPPRPKRKATHPYPQKAAKIAPTASESQYIGRYQASPAVCEPGYMYCSESSSALTNQPTNVPMPNWNYSAVPSAGLTNEADAELAIRAMMPTGCCSSSSESAPNAWHAAGVSDGRNIVNLTKAMPDFAQVYSFLGSVFDPDVSDHLQRLKMMDPIDVKTALLLMKNLSVNLMSPEFEDYRKLLSSYDVESGSIRSCNPVMQTPGNTKSIIPAV